MKKSTILAVAAALFMGQSMVAQVNVKEITYVEDATQGYLINPATSNWFITGEAGVANSATRAIDKPDFGKRFMPAAGLYFGKYSTPVLGWRAGFDWFKAKGQVNVGGTKTDITGVNYEDVISSSGVYGTALNNFGVAGDLMISLTNWWCGYNPNRVFNAQLYLGIGAYMAMEKNYTKGYAVDGWKNARYHFLTARAGLLFDFNVSKNFAIGIDLRAVGADKSVTQRCGRASITGEALLALTYKFNKATWNAPVVAVVPEIEDCEPIRARLQAANARIEDLEAQLRACLNRPVEKVVETVEAGPLATIYFPIGVSRLNYTDTKVLGAVAEQIIASGKSYTLTGWADTYTGTDAINARLRVNRAESVKNALVKDGVPADKLTTKSGEGNLNDLGIKYVALDRCVTIDENK